MECSCCGGDSKGVHLIVGLVKVSTFHCTDCGKVWRLVVFIPALFVASVVEDELRRLATIHSQTAKHARQYLRFRLNDSSAKTLEQRRLDAWERRLLRDLTQEEE